MEDKIKNAIAIMKKAYNIYTANAQRNIDKDEASYWHWMGIAEGTRRSFELLEQLLNTKEEI